MTFKLVSPEPGPSRCSICGTRTWRLPQHKNSKACRRELLRLMARRQELVQLSGHERWVLHRAGIGCLWIQTPEDSRVQFAGDSYGRSSKRPYAERWAVLCARKLSHLGEARVIELLRQGPEGHELLGELALVTLAPEEAEES